MSTVYDLLHSKHRDLLTLLIRSEYSKNDMSGFIDELVDSGKYVSDPGERDDMRKWLRYWLFRMEEIDGHTISSFIDIDDYIESQDKSTNENYSLILLGLILASILSYVAITYFR